MDHAMDVMARIGPVRFRFAGAATGILPEITVRPLTQAYGESVGATNEGALCLLVVDHRGDPAAPSRVELWRPVDVPETALDGLIVVADSVARCVPVRRFHSLRQLIGVLAAPTVGGRDNPPYRHD